MNYALSHRAARMKSANMSIRGCERSMLRKRVSDNNGDEIWPCIQFKRTR